MLEDASVVDALVAVAPLAQVLACGCEWCGPCPGC